MRWRRNRQDRPELGPRDLRTLWQVASLLLEYPDDALVRRAPVLEAALAEVSGPAEGLRAYLWLLGTTPLGELQRDYVDTFDVTRRCALHLTYFTCGDTRKRGVELVRFKQAYRSAGAALEDDHELPDYLPVLLEFGAFHDVDVAWRLLNEHRVGIELLHRALVARDSRWTGVVADLRATLPELDGTDEEALLRLLAEGPPSEDVGLETTPYALDPRLNPRPEPVDLGAVIGIGAPR